MSVSFPVEFANGNLFELLCLRQCDCEHSAFLFEAYSNLCFEKEDKYAIDASTDDVLIPVHEACMNLYTRHVRANLPIFSWPVDKICADELERLPADYDDVLSVDPNVSLAYDMCEQADSLNGHYGASNAFKWVTEDQFHPNNCEDGFVYDACCSNRVCYKSSMHDLVDAQTRFSTWIPST